MLRILNKNNTDKHRKMKTAVEWLLDWMGKNQYFIGNDLLKAVEQAKEMEKEQIIELLAKLDSDIAKELTFKPKQERMYSEEEVDKLLDTLLHNNMCSVAGDELIKQFKKK
jgi:hypothetical protein